MQTWILIYWCGPKQQYTTYFTASDREIAELHVSIFFRMLSGQHYNPEVLRSVWVSGESQKGNKVFQGSIRNGEGENKVIFVGCLYNVAEIKKESKSKTNDTDKTLLDSLKTHTGFPPI